MENIYSTIRIGNRYKKHVYNHKSRKIICGIEKHRFPPIRINKTKHNMEAIFEKNLAFLVNRGHSNPYKFTCKKCVGLLAKQLNKISELRCVEDMLVEEGRLKELERSIKFPKLYENTKNENKNNYKTNVDIIVGLIKNEHREQRKKTYKEKRSLLPPAIKKIDPDTYDIENIPDKHRRSYGDATPVQALSAFNTRSEPAYLTKCGIRYEEYRASYEPIWRIFGKNGSKTPTHYYNFRDGLWRRKGTKDWTAGTVVDVVKDIKKIT